MSAQIEYLEAANEAKSERILLLEKSIRDLLRIQRVPIGELDFGSRNVIINAKKLLSDGK